jgi:hypothetical protein
LLQHTVWGFQYDPVGVEMRSLLNVDNLIWGSDFPHQESDWPYSMKILDKAFANVPDDVRYKMTCGNAINFLASTLVSSQAASGALDTRNDSHPRMAVVFVA